MAREQRILKVLRQNSERLGIPWGEASDIPGRFQDIILGCTVKYGVPVVVLVDEYDKPILDNIDKPEIAAEMREGVKNLYSVLKGQDANLQFVFMTGVSKFSKVSLFSGVNQLKDITISKDFATICGYTTNDLRQYFNDHLDGEDMDELRLWYNGYSWRGDAVYNPYDILLFLSEGREYGNYWFETGSPSFLLKLFKKERYFLPSLENVEVSEEILDSFDVEKINPITLLFQTGYLTIVHDVFRNRRHVFKLKVPNFEVKSALSNHFINVYTDLVNEKTGIQDSLYGILESGDMEGLVGVIKRLFASIPWRNFTNNDLPDCEGYYASVLYAFFSSLDAQVIPEDITSQGQVDMTVKLGGNIYVMEIKAVDSDTVEGNPALDQIISRGYASKYTGEPGKTVRQLGLVFSRKLRNLVKADFC